MRLSRILPIAVAASLGIVAPASAQPRPTKGSDFPVAAFDSLDKVAFYLSQYDSFAWATTDTLSAHIDALGEATVARLGEEWFCVQRDGVWHAVFGRFDPATDR